MVDKDCRLPYNHLAILGITKLKAYVPLKEKMHMGVPEVWYDNPTWRCLTGHVTKVYLYSEGLGGAVCLDCAESIILTSPEDSADHKVKIIDPDKLEESRIHGSLIRRDWGSDWGVIGQYGIRDIADTQFVAIGDLKALQYLVPKAILIDEEW